MSSVFRLLLLLAIGSFGNVHADQQSIADGVYTEEQAEAGEALYETHCLTCHDKRYFRPVLKRWEGQPISMLYLIMSTSMPESNPASLPQDEYIDILAYILSLSRYPAGATPLDHADGALDNILVEPRKR
jgi:mono/diheme cytochrome c family protein